MRIAWAILEKECPPKLVSALRQRIERGESFQLTPENLATEADCTEDEAHFALDSLAKQGIVTKNTQSKCPRGHVLTADQLQTKICTACNVAFSDYESPAPIEKHIYAFEGEQTRDVRWALVLHGMNTRGSWQEEFSWLLSRGYGYLVPVAIYKYGVIRPGVLFPFRMRALTKQLVERISILSRDAGRDGFGGVPDVVAHSFGTWLIGHALKSNSHLKIGRVILLGSILRPDFDWESLIERGQAEAVMCHRATGDRPVAVTQYIIPDSGPSGRRGFNSGMIIEKTSEGLPHSGFFDQDNLQQFYDEIWQPFLTSQESVPKAQQGKPKNWRPTFWLIRARLFRYLIIATLAGIIGFIAFVMWLGLDAFVQRYLF